VQGFFKKVTRREQTSMRALERTAEISKGDFAEREVLFHWGQNFSIFVGAARPFGGQGLWTPSLLRPPTKKEIHYSNIEFAGVFRPQMRQLGGMLVCLSVKISKGTLPFGGDSLFFLAVFGGVAWITGNTGGDRAGKINLIGGCGWGDTPIFIFFFGKRGKI